MNNFLVLFALIMASHTFSKSKKKHVRNPVLRLRNGWEIDRDRLDEIMQNLRMVSRCYPNVFLSLYVHLSSDSLRPTAEQVTPEQAAILSEFHIMQREGSIKLSVRKVIEAAVRVSDGQIVIASPIVNTASKKAAR